MKFNYIISLGSDCLPRVSLTNVDIKKSKTNGELSCPFDLAVTFPLDIMSMIENDFEKLTDEDFIEIREINSVDIISNTMYNKCFFNHESRFLTDIDFSKDNFKLFKERYKERIKNFNKYINDNDILFVFNCRDDVDINKLFNCISTKFPNLRFELIVIHLYEAIHVDIDSNNKKIHYLKYYMKDIWNKNEDHNDFVNKLVGHFTRYIIESDNTLPI